MVSAVLTWIVTPGIGIAVTACWLLADQSRPQDRRAADYPAIVVGTHLALMSTGIAAWVVWVVASNGPGPWFGFVDLLVFAGAGDELLLGWLGDGVPQRWSGLFRVQFAGLGRRTADPTLDLLSRLDPIGQIAAEDSPRSGVLPF